MSDVEQLSAQSTRFVLGRIPPETPLILFKILQPTLCQFLVFENLVPHGDWSLVCEFGANGPRMVFGA